MKILIIDQWGKWSFSLKHIIGSDQTASDLGQDYLLIYDRQ